MLQHFDAENDLDAGGFPAGGFVSATGISINWQDGPLLDPETGALRVSSGAFVETVIAAAIQRLRFYQEATGGKFACRENAFAITKLEEALHWMDHRTRRRIQQEIEGLHSEVPT